MYLTKPKFDPEKYYSVYDLQRLIDYYNEMYSIGKSNYLQFETNEQKSKARVYLTGKYTYKECFGIKRYQANLYESGNHIPARDPRNMFGIKWLMKSMLSEEGEDNVRSVFKCAEEMPVLEQALSNDQPPADEPHTDWKYRYHYPEQLKRGPEQP